MTSKREPFFDLRKVPRRFKCLISGCDNKQLETCDSTSDRFMLCRGCSHRPGTMEPRGPIAAAIYFNTAERMRPAEYCEEPPTWDEVDSCLGKRKTWTDKAELIREVLEEPDWWPNSDTPLYSIMMRWREAVAKVSEGWVKEDDDDVDEKLAQLSPDEIQDWIETEGMDAEVSAECADSSDFSKENH